MPAHLKAVLLFLPQTWYTKGNEFAEAVIVLSDLRTRFLPDAIPLPEYPRPQLRRARWQNLNGPWDYALVCGAAAGAVPPLPAAWDGAILVPFCFESALSGVQRAVDEQTVMVYHRTFQLEAPHAGWRTLLHFGAVDHTCAVLVNGREAGRHTGGFCPFCFDITPYLRGEENELTVCVWDATDAVDSPRGKQVRQPKGIWYTGVSGIWQTVWLEQVPAAYIRGLRFTPSLEGVTVEADCDGPIELTVLDEDTEVAQALFTGNAFIPIPAPKHWTPETPHLYTVKARCGEDMVESYFALRTFGVGTGPTGHPCLLLNGKPYFQRGLLDQGYWPDGLFTAPTDEALRLDVENAKSLGFNMLRKHIKVEPARWYYHCDRLGMLVWQDMPSGGVCTDFWTHIAAPNLGLQLPETRVEKAVHRSAEGRRQHEAELREMIAALYNAPCICLWVPFNEAWGQFDAARICREVQALDATRPVDHASGWHDQGAGDLLSVHRYILRLRPPRRKAGDRRVFCVTEYGGYSHVAPGHVWSERGSFGYKMYKDRTVLTKAYRALHERQIFPLLAAGLAAVVYTQLTDVEGEVNGLYTYDRALCKVDEATVKEINLRLHF